MNPRTDTRKTPLPHWGRGGIWGRAAPVIVLLIALALAGCGRKGPPQPPPGVPDVYPRTYPSV